MFLLLTLNSLRAKIKNMTLIQMLTLSLLGIYYVAYSIKALVLKRQGITVNLLAKGNKPKRALTIELCLRFATFAGAVIQFASTIFPGLIWPFPLPPFISIIGVILLFLGNLIFIVAMLTMRNNWRAGFTHDQNTNLVTNGIYKYSRNPAFVGFDLLYAGCVVAFPNILNALFTLACIILFHFQILEEEKFLIKTFGDVYKEYASKTLRYFGKI